MFGASVPGTVVRVARRAGLFASLALAVAACVRHPPCRGGGLVFPVAPVAPSGQEGAQGVSPLRRAAVEDLDELAGAWTEARASACAARPHGAELECQEVIRDVARETIAALERATDAELERIPRLIRATRRLIELCRDPQLATLASDRAERGTLVGAAVALGLGRSEQALALAARAEARPEVRGLARLLRGHALLASGRRDEALVVARRLDAPALDPFAALLAFDAGAPEVDLAAVGAALRVRFGDASPDLAEVWRRLAEVERAAGRDPRPHLGQALALLAAAEPGSDRARDLELELGDLDRVAGDPAGALTRHREVLAHRQRRRGRRHFETAIAEHAVGADLEALARLEEAALHYTRAAEILQTVAPEDPQLARTYNNLGRLCYLRRDFEGARRFHLAALQLRRARLGEEHPDTATSHNNLGAVELAEGRFEAARAAFTRALEIRERTLGGDHPYLAVSLHNLAELAALSGDLEQAAALYGRALAIRRARFGEEHPETARTRYALGGLALARGEFEAAERELAAAYAGLRRSLGEEHPETRRARERLEEATRARTPRPRPPT